MFAAEESCLRVRPRMLPVRSIEHNIDCIQRGPIRSAANSWRVRKKALIMHVSGSATAVGWMPSEIVLFRCDTGGPTIVYMYIAPSRHGSRGRERLCPEPLVFLLRLSLKCYS